ncbi:MAG: FtsX-like permease family protein [Firmicutes bacterium]|nr:FtsX-like permease family protein [Bacillota bacterium]
MKGSIYPKLALSCIKKNRKLYFPYILTCIGMVMMFQILQSLSYMDSLGGIRGGSNLAAILTLGKFVIAVFALIFLCYTNSFLLRRRNREFGLYNILGMGKTAIICVIVWETLIISAAGLAGGIFFGVALSKLSELALTNLLHGEIDYSFSLNLKGIEVTAAIFCAIFLILFIKSLIQIMRTNPLDLLHSERKGEKPPKANYLLAVFGILTLAAAYYIAVSIKSPLKALELFFIAVIMVIIATYMIFTSGSVALCRALQKNKSFYYKKNHFVSVSSMSFRMKRNGTGLASICILCTMVLVMISSTSSLYIGAGDSIETRHPYDSELTVYFDEIADFGEENILALRSGYETVFRNYGAEPINSIEFRYAETSGVISDNVIIPHYISSDINVDYDSIRTVYFVPAEDYNRAFKTDISLEPGQAMLAASQPFAYDTIKIGQTEFRIVGNLVKNIREDDAASYGVFSIMLVVPDDASLEPLVNEAYEQNTSLVLKWYYAYDIDVSDEEMTEIVKEQAKTIGKSGVFENGYRYNFTCLASDKSDFYTTYGGLFFIGIILSIVFTFAAVLIIFYKQVTEGFEDCAGYTIMQNVGMTKKDIKKTVNSQVLTIFFAPPLFAGLHLAFSFPMVWKILVMFNLKNMVLAILVNASAFLVFLLFYIAVYRITSGAYFKIVSD